MASGYDEIVRENLALFFSRGSSDAAAALGARLQGNGYRFRAFGEDCILEPGVISLSGRHVIDPRTIVISLYALHSREEKAEIEPFTSFREFPGSMPYHGAFKVNAEAPLLDHVGQIFRMRQEILDRFSGIEGDPAFPGDFSLLLRPLPKIFLNYIFYFEDDELPPSATCLFSSNALRFLPADGLADTAEITTEAIIAYVMGSELETQSG